MHRETQPILLKGGESVSQRVSQLDQLSRVSHFSVSKPETNTQSPANISLIWSFSSSRKETIFQWLFPDVELCPLLNNTGTTPQHCELTDNTSSQIRREQVMGWLVVAEGSPAVGVRPVQRCEKHCRSFNLWLEPGDMVYADPRYWITELFPGQGQNIVCDVPVLWGFTSHELLCANELHSVWMTHSCLTTSLPEMPNVTRRSWNRGESANNASHRVSGSLWWRRRRVFTCGCSLRSGSDPQPLTVSRYQEIFLYFDFWYSWHEDSEVIYLSDFCLLSSSDADLILSLSYDLCLT